MREIKYWHKLTKEQKEKILHSGMKLSDFMEEYSQPPWCMYPEALASNLGCWSLMDSDYDINEDFCEACDQHKHNKGYRKEVTK